MYQDVICSKGNYDLMIPVRPIRRMSTMRWLRNLTSRFKEPSTKEISALSRFLPLVCGLNFRFWCETTDLAGGRVVGSRCRPKGQWRDKQEEILLWKHKGRPPPSVYLSTLLQAGGDKSSRPPRCQDKTLGPYNHVPLAQSRCSQLWSLFMLLSQSMGAKIAKKLSHLFWQEKRKKNWMCRVWLLSLWFSSGRFWRTGSICGRWWSHRVNKHCKAQSKGKRVENQDLTRLIIELMLWCFIIRLIFFALLHLWASCSSCFTTTKKLQIMHSYFNTTHY